MPFDVLFFILDIFIMPTIFFIAGYFALPSIEKRDTLSFTKGKMKRLGVPWLVGILLFPPFYKYIFAYSRGNQSVDLLSKFAENLENFLSFQSGYLGVSAQFDQNHFWFLSLLLVFFLVFAILYTIKRGFFKKNPSTEHSKVSSGKSILLTFFVVGFLTTVLTLLMYVAVENAPYKEPWIIFLSFVQFQPTKIMPYVLCFVMGIFAYSRTWLKNRTMMPGHFILWIVVSSVLLYFFLTLLPTVLSENSPDVLGILFLLVRTYLIFSILLTFISFGIQYFNSGSKTNRLLSANSYNIYLLHLVFVLTMQFFLVNSSIESLIMKFGIVSVLSLALSYLASQYVLRVFPRMSVLGLFILFALVAAFARFII